MKEFKPSKKSFHYKLVALGTYSWQMPKDFCAYWRTFILRLIGLMFVAGLIGTLGYMLVASAINSPKDFLEGVLILLGGIGIFIGVIAFVSGVVFGTQKFKESEPGLIRTKYRSWKGKYCPRVSYD